MATKFRPKYSNSGCGLTNDGPPVKPTTGKGLMNKTPSKDTTVPSVNDKDMINHNLLSKLGDDLTETDFMDEVVEDGTIKKAQGIKEPGVGKPTDGFTKPQKHNHKNSIAESIAAMMEDEAPRDLTMEQVFEAYLDKCNETASFEGFADHCASCDYEKPGHDDTMNMMDEHQGYVFTPVGDGLYRLEPVAQQVGIEDLPGVTSGPPMGSELPIGAGPSMGGGSPVPPAPPMGGGEIDIDGGDSEIDMDDEVGSDVDLDSDLGGDEEVDDMNVGGGVDDESLEDDEAFESDEELDDQTGIQENDIKSSAPQPAYDWNDGEGMEVTTARGKTVTESSVTTGQLASAPGTKSGVKFKKAKKAGSTKGAVKGMTEMGDPLKRKLKNDTKKGVSEGVVLPKSIAGNVTSIVEHVSKQLAKFPNSSKYTPSYRVVISLDKNKGYTASTQTLTEAAVDAEELAVIGKGNVSIEVALFEGKTQNGMFIVNMPKLKDRKPAIVAEGMVFRFPSIAKRISESVIGESVIHKVAGHKFGAIIKGDVGKMIAAYDRELSGSKK